MSETENLIEIATNARLCSLAPFSKFLVGAALRTEAGKIYTGCNIESASYGLTVCAERVAIWKALSECERKFSDLVIVVDTDELTPPCGTCRDQCEHQRLDRELPHHAHRPGTQSQFGG